MVANRESRTWAPAPVAFGPTDGRSVSDDEPKTKVRMPSFSQRAFFSESGAGALGNDPWKSDQPMAQDRWIVETVFKNRRWPGFFIEAGAADGVGASNSYVLEKVLGWEGICFEPNVAFFDLLRWNRDCLCLPFALSDQDGTVDFIQAGYLGTVRHHVQPIFDAQKREVLDHENFQRDFDGSAAQVVKRRAVTFRSVFERYGVPKIIDYMSLDLEGGEHAALCGFPFDTHTVLAMTIENYMKVDNQIVPHHHRESVNSILRANGMVSVLSRGVDEFFLHQSMT
jgi:hypothetical protein